MFARVRERGLAGGRDLAYFEWSIEGESPAKVKREELANPDNWVQANPASASASRSSSRPGARRLARPSRLRRRATGHRRLAVHGCSRYYAHRPRPWTLAWTRHRSRKARVLRVRRQPNLSWSSIAVAGTRPDGRAHIDIVNHQPGTGWVPARLAELKKRHRPMEILCDASGPVRSLLPALKELGIEPTCVSTKDRVRQACGMFYEAVKDSQLRHLGTPELRSAVDGAARRPLGDGSWLWNRRKSLVDISPLVACTLALFGNAHRRRRHSSPASTRRGTHGRLRRQDHRGQARSRLEVEVVGRPRPLHT